MIRLTRNLEELRLELNKLGPRQRHYRRGRTVMKILKPYEQANLNVQCNDALDLKNRFHADRERHKEGEKGTNLALVLLAGCYALWGILALAYLLG